MTLSFTRAAFWLATPLCLLAVGCGTLPDPTTLLTEPRILGLISSVEGEPGRTAARPGETLDLELIVGFPNVPIQSTYAFVVCRSTPTPLGVPICMPDLAPVAVFQRSAASFERPRFSVQIPAGATADLLLVGAICFGGPVRIDLAADGMAADLQNPCEGEGSGQILTGTVFVQTLGAQENHIPRAREIRFDGETWANTLPEQPTDCTGLSLPVVSLANLAPHLIEVVPAADAREVFEDPRVVPVATRTEELPVAFYSTGRGLEKLYSVIDADLEATDQGATPIARVEYSPEIIDGELAAPGQVVRFEMVMRDGRGGVSHESRALCLVR